MSPGIQRLWGGIARSGFVAAGLALGLVGAEGLIRVTGRDPLGTTLSAGAADTWNQTCTRLAAGNGYEFVPGRCDANSLGLQDRERSLTRAPGERRILAIGDSISADGAWTSFVETMLGETTGHPVDVLNLGVPGYSIFNELEIYRRRGPELDADAVILQVCLNDYQPAPVFLRSEDTILRVDDGSGAIARLPQGIFAGSALFRYTVYQHVAAQGSHFEDRVGRGNAAYTAFVDLAAARGQPLLVVVFPHLAPLTEGAGEEGQAWGAVMALTETLHVPTVDLTEAFTRVGLEKIRLAAGPAAYADLAATLSDAHLPASASGVIRAQDPKHLGVRLDGTGLVDDRVHPNFLGHYLAARGIVERIRTEAGWRPVFESP